MRRSSSGLTPDRVHVILTQQRDPTAWRRAEDAAILADEAIRLGLQVGDDALQAAADAFRMDNGLEDVVRFEEWLAERPAYDLDAFEAMVERATLARELRARHDDATIDAYFRRHAWRYLHAALQRLVVEDEGIARELHMLVVEEGDDLGALAQRYSVEQPAARCGGRVGTLTGRALGRALAERVAAARPGELLEPIETDSRWCLARVEAVAPAVLDAPTREAVLDDLVTDWIERWRADAAARR